jgi:thymidylate synthase (FAD)
LDAIMTDTSDAGSHRLVEFAGRHCYRSWKTGRERPNYIANIIEQQHGSVLEHATVSFAIQGVSRTLSHELVRHRVGIAISQESQRYVDASDIEFVVPPLLCHIAGNDVEHDLLADFHANCDRDLRDYVELQTALKLALGNEVRTRKSTIQKRVNEAARSRLPNASATRLTWTANMNLLRHFLEVRGSEHADLEIRRLTCHLHDALTEHVPLFFNDFRQVPGDFGVNMVLKTRNIL